MQENKSIGPFKAAGLALNTVGTAAEVLNTTVKTSGEVLHQGLTGINITMQAGVEALEIVANGALEDLKTDQIVEDAYRKVRIAEAKAEATKILEALSS